MTEPRCLIQVEFIEGLFHAHFVGSGKWFRRALRVSASFGQVKMASLLALDRGHGAIGDFWICVPV
jgi:hypothetical protein